MKPSLRILPVGKPPEAYWCGLFGSGYSSIGAVRTMSLAEALRVYFQMVDQNWQRSVVTSVERALARLN